MKFDLHTAAGEGDFEQYVEELCRDNAAYFLEQARVSRPSAGKFYDYLRHMTSQASTSDRLEYTDESGQEQPLTNDRAEEKSRFVLVAERFLENR